MSVATPSGRKVASSLDPVKNIFVKGLTADKLILSESKLDKVVVLVATIIFKV